MDNGAAGSINRSVKQPSVVSERMVLRPLTAKDARVVQRLARSHKVAYTKVEGRRQKAEGRRAAQEKGGCGMLNARQLEGDEHRTSSLEHRTAIKQCASAMFPTSLSWAAGSADILVRLHGQVKRQRTKMSALRKNRRGALWERMRPFRLANCPYPGPKSAH
jgi:hypothetical protein